MIKKFSGWKKYFTRVYWKIQIPHILMGRKPLNIIETFKGNVEIGDKTGLQILKKKIEQNCRASNLSKNTGLPKWYCIEIIKLFNL